MAQNRGDLWHINNPQTVSVTQMLAMIEYGTMNTQTAIEEGVVTIDNISGVNCSSITGSTTDLGSATGHAESTINEREGRRYVYTSAGRRAISYRGAENIWGNHTEMLRGINIHAQNEQNLVFIDNESADFSLPAESGWISGMGYGKEKFDWLYMPGATSTSASSALPVGDYYWAPSGLLTNTSNMVITGGHWSAGQNDGLFYYGCDKPLDYYSHAFGARLVLIPIKNNIYESNYAAWQAIIGG